MADHRAEDIVSAVLTKVTGLTTTGVNAFRGRTYEIPETSVPCVCVYQGGDFPLTNTSPWKFIDSELSIVVEAIVKDSSVQAETTLNQIRFEVSRALQQDVTQGLSYVMNTTEGSASITLDGSTNEIVGRMRMEWVVLYRRVRKSPIVISCAYPLDIEAGESPYSLMTVTGADENVASATMVGDPAQDPLISIAGPTGMFAGTSATLDFSTGLRVVETQNISVPMAEDLGVSLEAYRISGCEYTVGLANVVTWSICAFQDSSYRIRVFRGAGLTQVHTSTVVTCPTLMAVIYDANAGTFEVRADDVSLSLSDNTYTPAELVSFITTAEDSESVAGDAGKVLSAKKITKAAEMIGTYSYGETDPCGNEI